MEVFHRLEALEKTWGSTHLKVQNMSLTIQDNNGTTVKTIPLENKQELSFIHTFYGI